jgi:hypothetical protein
MGKYCNGFNNKIGGNSKIAKALNIKDKLDIDCLLYCEHRINFQHKDNKNDLKQMFQQELACTAIATHNVYKDRDAKRVQEGGTGSICFGDASGYVKKVGRNNKGLRRWGWILLGGAEGHSLQPMQKQKYQFWNHIPAATPILHHKEEGFNMPSDSVLQTPHQAHQAMACGWG